MNSDDPSVYEFIFSAEAISTDFFEDYKQSLQINGYVAFKMTKDQYNALAFVMTRFQKERVLPNFDRNAWAKEAFTRLGDVETFAVFSFILTQWNRGIKITHQTIDDHSVLGIEKSAKSN